MRNPLSDLNGCSKPWLFRAARSVPPNFSAVSTVRLPDNFMSCPKAGSSDEAKLALVADSLRSGNVVQLRALGASMLPVLWPGDLLTIEPIRSSELTAGKIVVVHCGSRLFIHRLIQTGNADGHADWLTRGDSLPASDPPTTLDRIIGRVTLVSRGSKSFVPSHACGHLRKLVSSILAQSDVLRIIVLRGYRARQLLGRRSEGNSAEHQTRFPTMHQLSQK